MRRMRTLAVVVGVAAMIVPFLIATSLTSTAGAAVHRKSAACASPKGQKINISWGDGNVSTTVYFNNHCAQKRFVQLEFVRENHTTFNKCIHRQPEDQGQEEDPVRPTNRVTLPAKQPTICD